MKRFFAILIPLLVCDCHPKAEVDVATKAEVQSAVQLGLKNTNTRIDRLEAKLQVGHNVGGDYTADSITSMILAGGLIVFLLTLLVAIVWLRAHKVEASTRDAIQVLESCRALDYKCDCGTCVDCAVKKLAGRHNKTWDKMVRKATPTKSRQALAS